MHTLKIFRVVSLVGILVATAIWFHERAAAAAAMQGWMTVLHDQEQRLSDLRAERGRLQRRLDALAQRNDRPHAVEREVPSLRAEALTAAEELALGKWTPVAAWKNEGRSTPRATVSTLLWAAAGGDLVAVQKILQFDDAARNAARRWFDALPPATRSLYATPEDLVASVTVGRIPPTNAELSWFHETDADHAIVGVMLAGAPAPMSEPAATIQPSVANEPPFLKSHNTNLLAVLNLARSPEGWRVVVPVAAINRMAKVLSVTNAH